jgi:hypothetical protein
MLTSVSRRRFLRALAAAGMLPIVGTSDAFAATALPHLSPDDATAKSLAYTEDAAKIDAAKEPAFKQGSKCSGCAQYQSAQASGGYAPCTIFPGKSVNANGWCKAFAAKPG